MIAFLLLIKTIMSLGLVSFRSLYFEVVFLFSVRNQVALVFGGSLCFPVRF